MKKNCTRTCFALIILAGIAVSVVRAQPAGTQAPASAKPSKTPASPVSPAAAAAKPPVPAVADSPEKVVLKVGPANVTKGEVEFLIANLNQQGKQALAMRGRRPLGDEYARMLVLAQQAESDHLDSSPGVRERLDLQRQQILASAEAERLNSDIHVSPDETTKYFTEHQPDFERVQIRQFVVRKSADGSKQPATGLTADEAKAKATAIRKAVTDGTDPKKVAEQFNIPNVVMIDTEPRAVQRRQFPPELESVVFALKEGEVTQPIDMPQGVILVQAVKHVQPEQKEVTLEIENVLKQQKMDAKLEELKKKSSIWMDEQYFSTAPALAPVSGGPVGGGNSAPAASGPTAAPQPPVAGPVPKQ